MAARDVAVEHCLTCADDEGVARSDLSREDLVAVQRLGVGWVELKRLARNALAPGARGWGHDTVEPVCAGEVLGGERPGAACAAFLAGSERAREQ